MKAKKDVLFLCQFFYPEYISSAQLPYDTVRALTKAGFSVDVLCGYPREYLVGEGIPEKEEHEGIRIRRLKYLQLNRKGFWGRLVNYFSFTFMVLLHLISFSGYRAVVVYSNPPILPWIASWAKALFGTKLIFVAYDLYPEAAVVTGTLRQGNMICRLMEHINRCVYRRADRVVALASEMRDYILANRSIAPEKIVVIPNWYPDEKKHLEGRKDSPFRQAAAGRFTVGYFGNMGIMQDMQTILDTMRAMKDEEVYFLFAGHGNKMEALKQAVEEEGITNAAIHGFLHGQEFADALSSSDCALITLAKGNTGLCAPSKTYSYMMHGLPLAAIMDESDIVRDIESGAGIWCRSGESAVLANAIRTLREDPEKLEAMGRRSRALYLEKYTTSICTGKYVSLMEDLLRK